jgi:hypothetical protein
MPNSFGLDTNLTSWLIMAALTGCWMISLRFTPGWAQEGWPSLVKSLYGFVWMDFGLDILLRFTMLSYNCVEWGNGSLRLAALSPRVIDVALANCLLFWVMLVLGFVLLVRRPTAGPLAVVRSLDVALARAAAIPVAVLASAIFYLIEGRTALPLVLITPLALLANLYMVPAAIVWWEHFRQGAVWWRMGPTPLIALLPAVVRSLRSPYRENLAPLVLIPLIAAFFAGRRPPLRILLPAALACLLILTSIIGISRQLIWGHERAEYIVNQMQQAGAADWFTGSWSEPMRRFHGFDSMLLTVALVPSLHPYSQRDVLVQPLIRGFVPRLLDAGKGGASEGTNFGGRIWAYDDPTNRDEPGASIAPSMPGDLYDANGVLYVAIGGLMWGILLGLFEGWKGHLPDFSAAALTCLVATQGGMSIERDFDNSIATFIQTVFVFTIVMSIVAISRRRTTDVSVPLGHLPNHFR